MSNKNVEIRDIIESEMDNLSSLARTLRIALTESGCGKPFGGAACILEGTINETIEKLKALTA